MGFKENLLKKIEIDKLAAPLAASVEPQADPTKFDHNAARRLIEMGGFSHVELKDRDLELYILEDDGEKKKIIVLDNGLAIYDTTIEDVALRKSPTVKEMVSFRNARKILSDEDVRVSKRTDSVRILKKMLIDGLDLTYNEDDIDKIASDGAASLDGNDTVGVMESLALLSEILRFRQAPKLFRSSPDEIRGDVGEGPGGSIRFGPAFIYDQMHNTIKYVAATFSSRADEDLERYRQLLNGEASADAQGTDVFRRLKELVMDRKPVLNDAP